MTSAVQSPITPRKLEKHSGSQTSPTPEQNPQSTLGKLSLGRPGFSGISDTASGLAGQAKKTLGGTTQTAQDTANQATRATGLDQGLASLTGLEIGQDGQVLSAEGNPLGRLAEGDPETLVGRTVADNGEVLDDSGQLVGRVEALPETMQGVTSQAQDAVGDLAGLEGLPVSEGGFIRDNTGQAVGKVVEGEAKGLVGYAPNSKGEIVDGDGDLVGRVEAIPQDVQDVQDVHNAADGADGATNSEPATADNGINMLDNEFQSQLPPLSTLEGLKCNKMGKIIGADGKPIGELIEGNASKIAQLGATLDDAGQFWDTRGNIIGKAQTFEAPEDDDAPFAGLEGLHVVEDGYVEDNRSMRVGKIVEGEPKKLLGRAVDEDGDVVDQHGTTIARAEPWEEPEEAKPDTSALKGLTCNKTGYVVGQDGVPIGRVVEGNPKELAGKQIQDGQVWDGPKPAGRVELIPENEREKKPQGVFSGLQGLVVNKDGFVEDADGNIVGQVTEGDIKTLRGRAVDEDGDVLDKFGTTKGHAEPYEPPEEEGEPQPDLSFLDGKVVNKAGNVVDAQGNVYGHLTSGADARLSGRKVDGQGQVWGDNGKVIGQAELVPGGEEQRPEGPFFGFDDAEVSKDGVVTSSDRIIGRVVDGDAKRLLGRKVDEDGDILDKNGNAIGRAERWEPEEKQRSINPMSGRKVTREGEVRDTDGNLIGKLTSGNLGTLVGKEIDDNGYVVDNDGNKVGECTLLDNIPEEPEPGPSPEEQEAEKKAMEDKQLAKKMSSIVGQTLDRVQPLCRMISERIEKAERTPKEDLDEEELVKNVKPLLEEAGQIMQECNGAVRALDPDGRIASEAKARAASHEASPEEHALADQLKELTETVTRTIENGRSMISDMPHAKKELNPLWGLLSEPLFQIIAAVGLLLNGVLSLVGRLLDGLGLGGLVKGLLGGLGLDGLLSNLGLTSLTDAIGLTGRK